MSIMVVDMDDIASINEVATIAISVDADTNDVILVTTVTRIFTNLPGNPGGPPVINISSLGNIDPLDTVIGGNGSGIEHRTTVYYSIASEPGPTTYNITATLPENGQIMLGALVLRYVDIMKLPAHDVNEGLATPADTAVLTNTYIIDSIATGEQSGIGPIDSETVPRYDNSIEDTNQTPGMTFQVFTRENNSGMVSYNYDTNNPSGDLGYSAISVGLEPLAAICVARNTQILMSDGTTKAIQDIKRGDTVARDAQCKYAHRVARLVVTPMTADKNIGIMEIGRNALGSNQPNADLIISSGHPILYHGNRYRAKNFRNFRRVKYHPKDKTSAGQILPAEPDNKTYILYNLQFEYDGYFIANGLTIDSVPTNSEIMPLPKNLYFNKALYNDKLAYKYVPPLNKTLVETA